MENFMEIEGIDCTSMCEVRRTCAAGRGPVVPKMRIEWSRDSKNKAVMSIKCETHSTGMAEKIDRLKHAAEILIQPDGNIGDTNERNNPIRQKTEIGCEVSKGADISTQKVQETGSLRINHGQDSKELHGDNKGLNEGAGMEKGKDRTIETETGFVTDPHDLLDKHMIPDSRECHTNWEENPVHYIRNVYKPRAVKSICIDFDGVIHDHQYSEDLHTWFNLYAPMEGAVESLQEIREAGWYIVIFTVRRVTPTLIEWFKYYGIRYHDINGVRPPSFRQWSHNPELTSFKPICDVNLDDKDLFWMDIARENGIKWHWPTVMETLRKNFPEMNWKEKTNA